MKSALKVIFVGLLCGLCFAAGVDRHVPMPVLWDDGHGFTVRLITNGIVTQRGSGTPYTNYFPFASGAGCNNCIPSNAISWDGSTLRLIGEATLVDTNGFLMVGTMRVGSGYASYGYPGIENGIWQLGGNTNGVDVGSEATNMLEVVVGSYRYWIPAKRVTP